MGKNKLARWAELGTFSNVLQPPGEEVKNKDHPLKGKWSSHFFLNNNPLVVELGCGKGEYTTGLSRKFPDNNYIGVDIKGARMWRGAKTSREQGLNNTAFIRTRIEFISSFFESGEVDEIWLTFPDPHPGKKNANKRLTCPWFLNMYRNFVKDKGIIHLKTDNFELFRYTSSLAEVNGLNIIRSSTDVHNEMPGDEILKIKTHYENLFLHEGSKINYLEFSLDKNKEILPLP
ncbi:MAG: tRNA (guanosine(46)-N7)-methyltransferase TrmB [Bacteroidales bacterium]|nr:tRNA (guanosine(46)-N7)-methyltransferase TrmB [Bacteroidales bacterium]